MPYELFLALRYLRMRRGRRVVKWTAAAALLGIACGVASLIVALALANGFREELREKILRGTAHITVARAGGLRIAESRTVAARLREVEGVSDATPSFYEGALLNGPRGSSYAVIRGVDAASHRMRDELQRTLIAGANDPLFELNHQTSNNVQSAPRPSELPISMIVGRELATRTGLDRVGAEGWIVTAESTGDAAAFESHTTRTRVAGIFSTGLHDYDSAWAYVSLDEAGQLYGAELRSAVVSVEVTDIFNAGRVAEKVRQTLGAEWTTVDWREANRPLFAALELERRVVALIILLIMFVAALNITTSLALVVVERRAEIAVLNALGANARSVMAIFVLEGAVIGAIGAVAGVGLGLAACIAANYFGFVRLPPDVYSISVVTLRPNLIDVAGAALAAFAVSLVATLYPARQAARVAPAVALRYE